MKKALLIVFCLVLCLSAVVGCGPKAPAVTPTPNVPDPTPAPTDWAYIQGKGEMIIGITIFAPMNYYDEKDNLIGFETEFAQAVCDQLGVKAKFQVINWKTKEVELNAKTIDCIWNGMTIDADRAANMDISVPYMENRQVLVAKEDNLSKYTDLAAGLKGANIVAEAGSAGESVAQKEAVFADATLTPVGDQAKALLEVKSRTADAALIDYVMSIGSIGEGTDYADVAVVPNAGFNPEEYGIAFRKGSPETLNQVNAAIQILANNGKLNDIAAKYKLQDLLLVKPSK